MKKRLLFVSIFLILYGCVSTPESKKDNDFVNDEGKTVVEKDNNEVFCQEITVSGTRIKKKICYTPAEKEALAERSKKILRDELNRGNVRRQATVDNEGGP
jgi:starvation-inducible outer membrane lipoprotein|tara:strand:- start:230 stop:532 length:303 start_codon:yes stop_codon:yes gene_type:complete